MLDVIIIIYKCKMSLSSCNGMTINSIIIMAMQWPSQNIILDKLFESVSNPTGNQLNAYRVLCRLTRDEMVARKSVWVVSN